MNLHLMIQYYKVISAANSWDSQIDLLVMGKNTEKVAQEAAKIKDDK